MSSDSSEPPEIAPVGPKTGEWIAPFSLFGIVASFFVVQIIGGIVLYRYGASKGWTDAHITSWLNNSISAQFVFLVISEGLLLLAIYMMMRFLRWTRQNIGLVRPKVIHLMIGAAAVVPYYLLYLVIVLVVSRFIPSLNVNQKQDIGFTDVVGAGQLLLTFVSLVVIPPFVEEIAMRGFLYSGLRTWLPKITAGIVVSLVFGAAHLAEGGSAGPLWIGAIDTFTLSLVLVYLREKTGSLWAGMVLHAAKNGIAFALIYLLHVS